MSRKKDDSEIREDHESDGERREKKSNGENWVGGRRVMPKVGRLKGLVRVVGRREGERE